MGQLRHVCDRVWWCVVVCVMVCVRVCFVSALSVLCICVCVCVCVCLRVCLGGVRYLFCFAAEARKAQSVCVAVGLRSAMAVGDTVRYDLACSGFFLRVSV